ncbi:hypothetical protein NEOLI_002597 [Neolecta irregularis DAH-3]|uniref:Uncharacterized protein n=1 Tax=Neolecta irregularis (strain DAH-3) TaxID=1198029 RepID=A0A1U7LIR0_NEOID|nr:hypothetical protein NEOLI_002597 [Neolecta irregularis DAH-3]|eukprot:OLL22537.1 hypothetical protein NEOLI_002597 [Neolecta irregularis DAH-3]
MICITRFTDLFNSHSLIAESTPDSPKGIAIRRKDACLSFSTNSLNSYARHLLRTAYWLNIPKIIIIDLNNDKIFQDIWLRDFETGDLLDSITSRISPLMAHDC